MKESDDVAFDRWLLEANAGETIREFVDRVNTGVAAGGGGGGTVHAMRYAWDVPLTIVTTGAGGSGGGTAGSGMIDPAVTFKGIDVSDFVKNAPADDVLARKIRLAGRAHERRFVVDE